ncbi:MAG: hypothetical protein KDA96_20870 [Planctomycetaceae bacterium]|nr:hypothetical protein [Planctomycetaceae bacterium]
MQNDPTQMSWGFIAVGGVVAGFGVAMIVWHVIQNRRHRENRDLTEDDRRFYEQQYRRRLQTSALAVTLGALISLCETLPAFNTSPMFATIYVFGLIMICLWLVLLALSDAVASRMHVSQSLRRNRKNRQALQEALAALKRAQEQVNDDDFTSHR